MDQSFMQIIKEGFGTLYSSIYSLSLTQMIEEEIEKCYFSYTINSFYPNDIEVHMTNPNIELCKIFVNTRWEKEVLIWIILFNNDCNYEQYGYFNSPPLRSNPWEKNK